MADDNHGSDGGQNHGWDGFDFNTWGESTADGSQLPTNHDDADASAHPGAGQWVSSGGVLKWEENGDEEGEPDPRAEAASHWGDEDVELPPGAPEPLRIRATRAWLLRQRAFEGDAIGYLLLERRRLQEGNAGTAEDADGSGHMDADAEDPLALALAEHQAAVQEYEALVEMLDNSLAHNGPAQALMEFYMRVTDRLADLAAVPEALVESGAEVPAGSRTPTPRSQAEWRGCAEASLHTRKRIEHITAPEPED